ncbi:MAG: glycosyltransferase family 4 protein [Gammaproteobacteria bacterium]|jgi:UDP-N-acetylmuramyl pentapeptide phosphotransferase/UDP-N-acetylglucosamine-1-phosphate transferase
MIWLLLVCLAVAAVSALATRALIALLHRRAILDLPNERSSHTVPKPRGGGLAVVPITLVAWAAAAGSDMPHGFLAVLGGAWVLAILSWVDDLRTLGPAVRFAVQAIVVAASAQALAAEGPVFQGLLPGWADTAAAAVLWLWFLNLFNFMDGIDGISGVETVAVGGGFALIAALSVAAPPALLGATLAAAAAGFLLWNWQPSRIFLGDVGSVPIGFLLGFLLLTLAARGLWAPALILPAYYLADATITILRRLLRGERIWRPHMQHFYQRAAIGGLRHADVSLAVLAANLVLIALAVLSLSAPLPALASAAIVVAALLAWMRA